MEPSSLALHRIAIAAIEALAAQGDRRALTEIVDHIARVAAPNVADPPPRLTIVGDQI